MMSTTNTSCRSPTSGHHHRHHQHQHPGQLNTTPATNFDTASSSQLISIKVNKSDECSASYSSSDSKKKEPHFHHHCKTTTLKSPTSVVPATTTDKTSSATTTGKSSATTDKSAVAVPFNMMTRLPDSFLPGPHDVLCGRGRACKTATGNQAYRLAVQEQLAAYQAADSKLRKGSIITGIVNRIRIQCHEYHERHHDNRRQSHGTEKDQEQKLMMGGFVKCVASTWYEVGDFLAREKTSQCFRDALSASYSSSAQSKYARRRAKEQQQQQHSVTAMTTTDMSDRRPMQRTPSLVTLLQPTIRNNGVRTNQEIIPNKRKRHLSEDAIPAAFRYASSNNTRDVPVQSSHHLPPKKRKRRPSEHAVADVLQHMASFSGTNSGHHPPTDSSESSSLNTSPTASLRSLGNNTIMAARPPAVAARSSPMQSSVLQREPTISTLSVPLRLSPEAITARSTPTVPSTALATAASQTTLSSSCIRGGQVVRVCALQPALRPPSESPWEALIRVQRQIMQAIVVTAGNEDDAVIDLFVLPELSTVGYSEDTFAKYLPVNAANQAMYQEFDRLFQDMARNLQVYICYGTIGWSSSPSLEGPNNGAPRMFIRQVVVDRTGKQVAVYDKTHLCDYGVCAETRFFQPGPFSHPVSFPVKTRDGRGSFRFGLVICADMRYPDLARKLTVDVEHRVDCILQPSAFARDCSFRTWSSFRETRAVENSIYWIGVNYAGTDYGESSIVPPWVDGDHEPTKLGCEEGYVIGHVARRTLDHVREALPFYRNLFLEEFGRHCRSTGTSFSKNWANADLLRDD